MSAQAQSLPRARRRTTTTTTTITRTSSSSIRDPRPIQKPQPDQPAARRPCRAAPGPDHQNHYILSSTPARRLVSSWTLSRSGRSAAGRPQRQRLFTSGTRSRSSSSSSRRHRRQIPLPISPASSRRDRDRDRYRDRDRNLDLNSKMSAYPGYGGPAMPAYGGQPPMQQHQHQQQPYQGNYHQYEETLVTTRSSRYRLSRETDIRRASRAPHPAYNGYSPQGNPSPHSPYGGYPPQHPPPQQHYGYQVRRHAIAACSDLQLAIQQVH